MAKQRTTVEADPNAPAPVPGLVELSQPADAQSDDRDAIIEQLRERLARMQAERAAPAPPSGPSGLFRVSLDGARCKRPTVTVEPHEGRAGDKDKGRPTKDYDGLDLFIRAGHANLSALAWERYRAEFGLEPGARRGFKVRVEGGPTLDSLEIPAASPYEAEALFKRFNGIENTARAFKVERVEEPGEELASK